MASADRSLLPDSIPTIDLRYLSQSELYALSLCSASSFDPRTGDDVVIPKIDRSVFNESAGSRKQTYSRLRLAPAASAASICRRTPHLRSPKPSSIETDPERAENSQIVALLKGLFASETNGDDFVPIQVENSNPVPDYRNSIADLSKLSNPGNDGANNGMKRKRGRPRKDENAVVPAKIEIKDIFIYENVEKGDDSIVNSDFLGNDNVKKRKRGRPRKDGVVPVKNKVKDTVVFVNVEESDKEVVNSKGVIVDVAALAGLEDPFGQEIRRRSEGLGRVDELLGFLEGLGGRWGSRRKKKKVVDASDFGDHLPKGWKISISLKRKEGRVWLFCRRYISPSGRQFISCKEVSSYLLSICGLQDKNQPSFPQGNENKQFECEMASRNAADIAVLENNRKNDLVSISPITIISTSNNHKEQINLKIGEPVEDKVRDTLKCHKCMMTFERKDDLLQHHLLSHRKKRSKIGTSVTDGVIIRGGQYECQFCHKTFNERNRYNGHVGNHVKNDVKGAEESTVEHVQENADSSALGEVPNGGSLAEAKISEDEDAFAEPLDTNVNDLDSDFCKNKLETSLRVEISSDKLDYDQHYLANGKQDLQAKRDGINIAETSDKQGWDCLSSGDKVDHIDDSMTIVPIKHKIYVESEAAVNNNENDSIFETSGGTNVIECASDRTNECFVERKVSLQICSPYPDEQKFMGLENNMIGVSATVKEPNKKVFTGSGSPMPNGNGEPCGTENMFVDELKLERERVATIESISGSYAKSQTDAVASFEEGKQCENNSVVLPLSDGEGITENYGNEISSSMVEESRQQEVSLSRLFSLSGHEQNCGVEKYVDSLSARKLDSECKKVETCRNSELIVSFGSSELNADVTSTKERSLEFCSLLPSGTGKIFDVQDNVTRQEHTGSGLLTQSCFAKNSSDVYTANKIYNTPVDELKFDDVQSTGNHDLCLAFNNPQAGPYADTTSFEHEKYPANWSSIPSRIEQNVAVQTNLNRVNNTMVEEGVGSLSGLFSLSCNGNLWGSENNFNTAYSDRGWEGPEVDEVGNSENKKYMVDFGCNNDQPGENLMPGGTWRTGKDDTLQSNLADTSNPMAQSPSSRNFNIVSDKTKDGLFRLNEKYDRESCFEGSRSGRTEPVEFRFLTTQNLTSLPGDSKNFSYDTGMEQELDSSYWLGKHDLMPNMTARSQVTALCVWCRNEFYHEPVHSGMQAEIGSLCPTCRTRISDQVNEL